MTRQLNQESIDHIKRWEGFRAEAYPDPGSRDGRPLTIGYGTTRIDGKPVAPGARITDAEAERHLRRDLISTPRAARSNVR